MFWKNTSIRLKLIVIGIILMTIPIAMSNLYIREMDRFLWRGQKEALLTTAKGIATILNDQSEFFSQNTAVPEVLGKQGALYTQRIEGPIQLNGETEDWESLQVLSNYFTGEDPQFCDLDYDLNSFSIRNIIGYNDTYLYGLFEVNDLERVFRDPAKVALNSSDQMRILLERGNGNLERYLLLSNEPGRMSAFLMDDQWEFPLTGDNVAEVQGELAETDWGYVIELRIPRSIIGYRSKIGFSVVDVDDSETREVRQIITTSPRESGEEPTQVIVRSPGLAKVLEGLGPLRSRIWVLDRQRQVRSVAGNLWNLPEPGFSDAETNTEPGQAEFIPVRMLMDFVDRLFPDPPLQFKDYPPSSVDRPDQIVVSIIETGNPRADIRMSLDDKAEIIVAGHPIFADGEIIGAVLVEQSSTEVSSLHYQFVRSLSVVTVLVFFSVLVVLAVFAWRLTMRIRKLHNITDQAITPEGRVRMEHIPKQDSSNDELGALNRSFSSMLSRLSGYMRYLEKLPDTLAHEMNNPLGVVSSSLEMLENDIPQTKNNHHMQRATYGIHRLKSLLSSLTEAASLEEALQDEEKESINLPQLISDFVSGNQYVYTDHEFRVDNRSSHLFIEGSPEYLAQMLDKLIDNATEYSTPDTPIIVRSRKNGHYAEISVLNEGSELQEDILERLFEPMVSGSNHDARKPHLGLGLYVVKVISEYHGGSYHARNRAGKKGVEFTVSIPLLGLGANAAFHGNA
ncbi:MAG: ATP-binding protein [Gammaproteobacteria bacterium]|nr:ATP-binding protein [Gammaproteobacteria bacterium]MCY4227044.1 ATP-binding protein [Gammaproteobacteria bacterium]